MENNFWQANFWGIVGTASGALGLIIAWLNWRYSKPAIKITSLRLTIREFDDRFLKRNKETNPNAIKNHLVDFELDITIANKKGGPGAIEKPVLIFRAKSTSWFKPVEEIIVRPITKIQHHRPRQSIGSFSSYEIETENLGKSFNLKGGEIIDDTLEYRFRGEDESLIKLIKNYEHGHFYIRYHTNFGKKHERKLDLSFKEH